MDQYNESDVALQDNPQPAATNNTILNNNTNQQPQADYQYQQQHIPQPGIYNSIINSLSGWMKFLGIYTIVIGAITCIGIISAAMGIPLIFAGISLTNASKAIKEYADFNNPNVLYNLFTYLKKYFKIQGIMVIVALALTFVYIVIILVVLALGAYSYMYNY
ncbi:DUF5362 domain-containing protein [Ruminiclostridium papyrosolvens]|uniref:DUF5362 domain-containing protein n=1 Tax=Ruminiclostridium papyrosolvens C7 TaxID=1330534 RepID=U4R4N2_9FIRM|nr:DUF5362 domain-containing protein [Ruminiclostridium papyrosolvens]EPR13343.1 hypothetical protein L323_05575 [Ruminiclostridium papyrosolvens C7]